MAGLTDSNLSMPSAIQIDSATFLGLVVASTMFVQSSVLIGRGAAMVLPVRTASIAAASLSSGQVTVHSYAASPGDVVFQWKNSAGTIYHARLAGSAS